MKVNNFSAIDDSSTALHGSEVGSQIQAVVNVIELQEENEQNINPIPFTATTVDEIDPTLNYSMTGEQLSQLMRSTPRA